ncbi:MAG: PAS domain S-box protein [Mariniphaga sp.]|nr:PAS domain S-box protein [Mariniphaga sp.]
MIAHDLFLLMLNLFQIKNKDKAISVFIESVECLFAKVKLKFYSTENVKGSFKYELRTVSKYYGTIVFNKGYKSLSEESRFYLDNSCAMLTVILEKITNDELFKTDKKSLELIALQKTIDLQQSEAKFRELHENMPIALFRSTIEGKILEINRSMVKMYGFESKEELLLKPASEYYDNLEDRKKIIKSLFETGEALNVVTKEKKKDGTGIWVRSNYRAFYDPENKGEIKYIDGVAIDITDSINYQSDLNKYHNDLEKNVNKRTSEIEKQAVKLRESQKALTFLLADVNETRKELENVIKELAEVNKDLESFSYSVSHDLRAPLRAINGFTEILKEDYNLLFDDEGKRILNVIVANVGSMTQLIDDLLAFTRIGRKVLNKDLINTNEFIETIISELISPLKKKPTIKISNLPKLYGDHNLLRQVFINLISNAIKFTLNIPEPIIIIKGQNMDAIAEISIEDNGIGFDNKYGEKIFEVFQRLHTVNEFEGAGVGLSIVKKIIEKHEGNIIASGEPNNGAKFIINLPH